MFHQLFASMNEVLDEIIVGYASASHAKKTEMEDKLRILRGMSDTLIEQWLLFEEKFGKFMQQRSQQKAYSQAADPELSDKHSDVFQKGQGYYKLQMYDEAIRNFETFVYDQPDFLLARIYLAMCHLRKGNMPEAYGHFKFLIHITENDRMKAISYNALGCIHVHKRNLVKACEFFRKAYNSDPSSIEPLFAMGLCYENKGTLEFMFDV
jgi:tetratricopeptide (TPR) repeat protein